MSPYPIFGTVKAVLTEVVQSVIRRLPDSLSCMEESMAGHMSIHGVY
jgi:hypothetical protein